MESNIKRKYQKPEIDKRIIDKEISLILLSGGTEGNAPHGPFGKQNNIDHSGKNDPLKA